GWSAARAYREAGYAPGASETCGPRLARTVAVRARLATLQEETCAMVRLSKSEVIEKLALMLLSRPSEASADNPLCEGRVTRHGLYYVFPGKLECLKLLGKYCGCEHDTGAGHESFRDREPVASAP